MRHPQAFDDWWAELMRELRDRSIHCVITKETARQDHANGEDPETVARRIGEGRHRVLPFIAGDADQHLRP